MWEVILRTVVNIAIRLKELANIMQRKKKSKYNKI